MRHQRARDLQALQHAAGERARQIVDAVGVDLHLRQPVDRLRTNVAVMPRALRHQPFADIAAGGDVHAQVLPRILMHETPVGTMQRAQRRRRHRVHVVQPARRIAIPDGAGIGRQPAGQHVQQRRLAGARFADHRQHLARPQIDIDAAQRGDGAERQRQTTR